MLKKRFARLALATSIALCIVLLFAQAALATAVSGGGTSGSQTGGGTSTSSGTPGTGAPLIIAGAIGAAIAGAGYMLRRKSDK